MSSEDLPLRDQLALTRTDLANRRTWLAYARTALALFVTGVTFQQFFDLLWVRGVGVLFLASSLPTLGFGWRRFRIREREIDALEAAERAMLQEPSEA